MIDANEAPRPLRLENRVEAGAGPPRTPATRDAKVTVSFALAACLPSLVAYVTRCANVPGGLVSSSVALIAGAALVVHGVRRTAAALHDRDEALMAARERNEYGEILLVVAWRAVVASHELSAPLRRIAAAADELDRPAARDTVALEARRIRAHVEQCRAILSRLRDGGSIGG